MGAVSPQSESTSTSAPHRPGSSHSTSSPIPNKAHQPIWERFNFPGPRVTPCHEAAWCSPANSLRLFNFLTIIIANESFTTLDALLCCFIPILPFSLPPLVSRYEEGLT